tara:strand:- start:179 stop:895 length:717 start_codon:yes stop_codon:yes gene_type:complete
MKPKLKALIVGAGGVTSYMLPALKNSFDLQLTLIDGDVLEKRNLDRQLFRNNHVGMNKAEALMRTYNFRKNEGQIVRGYFDKDMLDTEYKFFFHEADVLICCADNHPARRHLLEAAIQLDKPILICANEYSTSQAYYFDPRLMQQYPMMNPLLRYPELQTSNEGSPIRCQGEALEATPQLAIANQTSASLGNLLLWLWFSGTDTIESHMPVEYQTTFSRIETITLADLINIQTPTHNV